MEYYNLDKTKTFLVSLKALIIEEDHFLLLRDAHGRNLWELPGGLLEMDEDLEAGLKREVFEETHLDVKIGKPVSVCDGRANGFIFKDGRILDTRVILFTYVCTKISHNIQLSEEHTEFIWANETELLGLELAPDCASAIKDYLA